MPRSDAIANFYDSHPYPPPVEDLEMAVRGWDDPALRRIEHSLHWPTLPFREDPAILVAGCGTSQAARWAARHPQATVVGIDVSLSSLEATGKLACAHGIDNLELRELPIEEVATLGRSFDLIVCTGVLHHLADPTLGLRALRDALAPRGALQLMVYARYGRLGISMIRDYSRRLGLHPSTHDLTSLIETLREIPVGHPMSHVLRDTPDFRDPDALADALLNPREQSYTVPGLFELLSSGGVRFARWLRQAPYRPQCGVMSGMAHGERIARLDEIDQYAVMELFRGTITRHSLIAYRDDASFLSPLLDWEVGEWREYVAMTPTTVVVVEEGLPPGAAAGVINRAHVDTDLVCLVGPDEFAVFSSIDGEKRLGAIPGATPQFIQRLWMHDLVVVDASAVAPASKS